MTLSLKDLARRYHVEDRRDREKVRSRDDLEDAIQTAQRFAHRARRTFWVWDSLADSGNVLRGRVVHVARPGASR